MSIKRSVLSALQANPGLHMTVEDLAEITGLSTRQVGSAAHQLIGDGDKGVERTANGVYRFSNRAKSRALLEVIADSDGKLVVQDENGNLRFFREMT